MKIAITGATGFLGRYIVNRLAERHELRCWHRATSDRSGFERLTQSAEWRVGELGDDRASRDLVGGCEAIVHAALNHPGGGF